MIVPAFLCHLRKDNFESGNDRIQWLVGEIDRAADQFLQTSAHAGDRDKASGTYDSACHDIFLRVDRQPGQEAQDPLRQLLGQRREQERDVVRTDRSAGQSMVLYVGSLDRQDDRVGFLNDCAQRADNIFKCRFGHVDAVRFFQVIAYGGVNKDAGNRSLAVMLDLAFSENGHVAVAEADVHDTACDRKVEIELGTDRSKPYFPVVVYLIGSKIEQGVLYFFADFVGKACRIREQDRRFCKKTKDLELITELLEQKLERMDVYVVRRDGCDDADIAVFQAFHFECFAADCKNVVVTVDSYHTRFVKYYPVIR